MIKKNNLNIQVFSSCNCDCKFCNFTDKCHNKIDPNFAIDYVKNNPSIRLVLLTGGEPTFAIEECGEIIKNLKSDRVRIILQTNGWWGDNDKVKEVLRSNPPTSVHLSVDSEKQKIIDLEVVKKAVKFLEEIGVETFIVNHHEEDNEEEFEYYKTIFPNIKYGSITHDDGKPSDCGPALLATNQEGTLDIKGWR